MAKTLYVGNLPWSSTEDDVRVCMEEIGPVHACRLVIDRETGRSRGFAFVDMDDGDAQRVIDELDGTDFDGRPLRINEARPREGGSGGGRREFR